MLPFGALFSPDGVTTYMVMQSLQGSYYLCVEVVDGVPQQAVLAIQYFSPE